MAAIILETVGVQLMDIPLLSIERVQANPFTILPVVLRQITNSRWGVLYSIIILLTVSILLLSNFISTVLLSDFQIAEMAGLPVSNITAITYNGSEPRERPIDDNGKPYWQTKPSAHWRFAETRFGNSRFGDTGRTYRAMLPFRDEVSRTKLETYSGPAIVANTRAMCAPMPLRNFTFNATADSWDSLKELRLQEGTPDGVYEYALDLPYHGWSLSLCTSLHLNSDVDPESVSDIDNEGEEDKLEREYYHLRKIVVLNVSNHFVSIYDDIKVENGTVPDRLRELSSKADGLWTRIYDSIDVEVMAASACYYNIRQPGLYHVNMSGKAISQEPAWNENNTEAILLQLGIGPNA
ncbi:hypothetical protein ACKLNR_007196 [Fusarium oxysporum f. sp. zingiberi]